MSTLPENEKDIEKTQGEEKTSPKKVYKNEFDQFGTIFSEPQEKERKKVKKSFAKRQLTSIIACVLALCLLVGGTIAVVKLVPEKDDEIVSSTPLYTDISLANHDISKITSVTVTNSNGTYKFLPYEETVDGTVTRTWYIDGIDRTFVESTNIEVIIKAAASITAKRTITEKTAEECGLDTPKYSAVVEGDGFNSYTYYLGSDSPDQTGTYAKISDDNNIYLIDGTGHTSFQFDVIELASSAKMPASTFKTSVAAYSNDQGVLSKFDTLTMSGKHFSRSMTFAPNPDETLSTYLGYLITSEPGRYADSIRVTPMFKFFSEGLTAVGAYTYDISPQSIAKYGLNNPDAIVTLSVAGETKQFKFAIVDDTYCAVINDESGFIRKIALEDVPILKYNNDDFYSPYVFIRAIYDISNLTVTIGDDKYSFDISENGSDSDEECTVICNGKKIKSDYFQNFYEKLIGVTAADFEIAPTTEEPEMTISYTSINTGKVDVISYTKSSATKYQYSENGTPIGRIVSSEFNRIVKYVKNVANNKDIN